MRRCRPRLEYFVALQHSASVRARPLGDIPIFSEPCPDGPADGLEQRVAATDRAAHGSAVLVPARQPHAPVRKTFPQLRRFDRFVLASAREPVCWQPACVGATAKTLLIFAGVRTIRRWSASCRSAVSVQAKNVNQRAQRVSTIQGIRVGCFCSGDNTSNILHVGLNCAHAGIVAAIASHDTTEKASARAGLF